MNNDLGRMWKDI